MGIRQHWALRRSCPRAWCPVQAPQVSGHAPQVAARRQPGAHVRTRSCRNRSGASSRRSLAEPRGRPGANCIPEVFYSLPSCPVPFVSVPFLCCCSLPRPLNSLNTGAAAGPAGEPASGGPVRAGRWEEGPSLCPRQSLRGPSEVFKQPPVPLEPLLHNPRESARQGRLAVRLGNR